MISAYVSAILQMPLFRGSTEAGARRRIDQLVPSKAVLNAPGFPVA